MSFLRQKGKIEAVTSDGIKAVAREMPVIASDGTTVYTTEGTKRYVQVAVAIHNKLKLFSFSGFLEITIEGVPGMTIEGEFNKTLDIKKIPKGQTKIIEGQLGPFAVDPTGKTFNLDLYYGNLFGFQKMKLKEDELSGIIGGDIQWAEPTGPIVDFPGLGDEDDIDNGQPQLRNAYICEAGACREFQYFGTMAEYNTFLSANGYYDSLSGCQTACKANGNGATKTVWVKEAGQCVQKTYPVNQLPSQYWNTQTMCAASTPSDLKGYKRDGETCIEVSYTAGSKPDDVYVTKVLCEQSIDTPHAGWQPNDAKTLCTEVTYYGAKPADVFATLVECSQSLGEESEGGNGNGVGDGVGKVTFYYVEPPLKYTKSSGYLAPIIPRFSIDRDIMIEHNDIYKIIKSKTVAPLQLIRERETVANPTGDIRSKTFLTKKGAEDAFRSMTFYTGPMDKGDIDDPYSGPCKAIFFVYPNPDLVLSYGKTGVFKDGTNAFRAIPRRVSTSPGAGWSSTIYPTHLSGIFFIGSRVRWFEELGGLGPLQERGILQFCFSESYQKLTTAKTRRDTKMWIIVERGQRYPGRYLQRAFGNNKEKQDAYEQRVGAFFDQNAPLFA